MSFSTISQLLRFRHYIKNVVVVMPAFFAGTITHDGVILDLLYVFVGFCLTASAVYIMSGVRWDSFRVYFDTDITQEITLECPIHMHFGPGEYEVYARVCHEDIISWRASEKMDFTIVE